jgi:hypothetical protein
VFERLKNLPNQYFKGNNLSDTGRTALLQEMRTLLKSRRKGFDEVNTQFERRAKATGSDPELFIRRFEEDDAVRVQTPDGRFKRIPRSKLRDAIQAGGTVVE